MSILNRVKSLWGGNRQISGDTEPEADKKITYKDVITDPEIVEFFESTTPSVFRRTLTQNMQKHGFSQADIDDVAGIQRYRERLVDDGKRKDLIKIIADQNCAAYYGKRKDDSEKKKFEECLSFQMKMLWDLGYRVRDNSGNVDLVIQQKCYDKYAELQKEN